MVTEVLTKTADKGREKVKGKKTYILGILGILGIWADYFLGLGVSSACENLAEGVECRPSISTAVELTWALVMAMTIRAGIKKGEVG